MTQAGKTNGHASTTFINNMKLPIHRWYRYSAGFSAQWAEKTIASEYKKAKQPRDYTVLDPFAGSGTTLLAADQVGVSSIGFESQPLVWKIASTKLAWDTDPNLFTEKAQLIAKQASTINEPLYDYPELVQKCYDEDNLRKIDQLRKSLERNKDDTPEYKLSWLAFVCILRTLSHAGTATWQYILPSKSKSTVPRALNTYLHQVEIMANDLIVTQNGGAKKLSRIIKHDSREYIEGMNNTIDLIVTSPPYANNYDYADATRLELSVLGDIKRWSDLQDTVRPGLVRSCSQMVSKETERTFEFLEEPILSPIHDEIKDVCCRMKEEREKHGGKKNYYTMIALYFLDLAHTLQYLRIYCKEGSRICFVIGDSAPYGIYVPVDRWLGAIAQSAGFKSYKFSKTRDRNIKWKNRKHRVPLKEGYLWIEG